MPNKYGYLTHTDPEAFHNLEKLQPTASHIAWGFVLCPKCHGFGKWNILLDFYGPGLHQKCCCDQCDGNGYVSRDDAKCVHEFGRREAVGKSLWNVTCLKCGQKREIDTSD